MSYKIRISDKQDCKTKTFDSLKEANVMMKLMNRICESNPGSYAAYLMNEKGNIIDCAGECSESVKNKVKLNESIDSNKLYDTEQNLKTTVKEVLKYLMDNEYPFPEHKYLADSWEDWLTDYDTGECDVFEDADCLLEYLGEYVGPDMSEEEVHYYNRLVELLYPGDSIDEAWNDPIDKDDPNSETRKDVVKRKFITTLKDTIGDLKIDNFPFNDFIKKYNIADSWDNLLLKIDEFATGNEIKLIDVGTALHEYLNYAWEHKEDDEFKDVSESAMKNAANEDLSYSRAFELSNIRGAAASALRGESYLNKRGRDVAGEFTKGSRKNAGNFIDQNYGAKKGVSYVQDDDPEESGRGKRNDAGHYEYDEDEYDKDGNLIHSAGDIVTDDKTGIKSTILQSPPMSEMVDAIFGARPSAGNFFPFAGKRPDKRVIKKGYMMEDPIAPNTDEDNPYKDHHGWIIGTNDSEQIEGLKKTCRLYKFKYKDLTEYVKLYSKRNNTDDPEIMKQVVDYQANNKDYIHVSNTIKALNLIAGSKEDYILKQDYIYEIFIPEKAYNQSWNDYCNSVGIDRSLSRSRQNDIGQIAFNTIDLDVNTYSQELDWSDRDEEGNLIFDDNGNFKSHHTPHGDSMIYTGTGHRGSSLELNDFYKTLSPDEQKRVDALKPQERKSELSRMYRANKSSDKQTKDEEIIKEYEDKYGEIEKAQTLLDKYYNAETPEDKTNALRNIKNDKKRRDKEENGTLAGERKEAAKKDQEAAEETQKELDNLLNFDF